MGKPPKCRHSEKTFQAQNQRKRSHQEELILAKGVEEQHKCDQQNRAEATEAVEGCGWK